MNCREITELLHAYLDNELDPVRSLEAEQHLKDCPACQQQWQQQQALRTVIVERSPYFKAPTGMRQRVRTAVREASQAGTRKTWKDWDWSWLWFRVLVPSAVTVMAVLLALPWFLQPSAQSRLSREIVSAHVRSLLPDHLTDVASTDQHTVKPWFNGRVTFSPPVVDAAAQGFPLVGGRLDVVGEQSVAALVYQRRKHYINLFIWPSTRTRSTREKVLNERGYNLVHWTKDGMEHWAVSDLSRAELQEFARHAGAVE